MRTRYLPYHLGIIIPCALIVLNGGTGYYAVFRHDPGPLRWWFLAGYAYVWVTYVVAIFKSPGYTGPGDTQVPGANYVECARCHYAKPERAHHCRVCKRCVLRMDHHCPWTENCVGFANLPHFLRFVGSAVLVTAYVTYRCGEFLLQVLKHRRHLSRVAPHRFQVAAAVIGLIGDLLVSVTLSVLWLRVVIDTFNGHTQIEAWEQDRVEVLVRRKMAPNTPFPFDVDPISNFCEALGPYPWDWILPWGQPSGSGHAFKKLFPTSKRWPPPDSKQVNEHEYYRADRWVSFEGDNIADYGVDVDVPAVADRSTGAALPSSPESSDDEDVPLDTLKRRKPPGPSS